MGIEHIVDELRADLELRVEVRIAVIALGVHIILHTGDDFGEVDISEVVSLQEASEVDTEQIAHGVDLSLGRSVIFESFNGLSDLTALTTFNGGFYGLGSTSCNCGTHCECKEKFGCLHF
jgi:hypothetical protein